LWESQGKEICCVEIASIYYYQKKKEKEKEELIYFVRVIKKDYNIE